ncbi:hypothetical protein [Fusobacterium ulcerans]|uniref:hypothetical protein n=1 Tax=Fusobacterium ulcerans TaxID=861 RepID=UPI00241EDFBD|nr:hypothetical protein [Fusobacterium ulcerans]
MGKKGRPLGSGSKNKTILGVRVTDKEFEIIQKGIKKLKTKFKTNREIIIYLFKKYNKFEINERIIEDNLLLKLISEELSKNKYTKEEKMLLKRVYKEIQKKGITSIFYI